MAPPFSFRHRLAAAGLVLAACLGFWGRADAACVSGSLASARPGDAGSSTRGSARIGVAVDGDFHRRAVDRALTLRLVGAVGDDEHASGRAVLPIREHIAARNALHAVLNPSAIDDSDTSDPSVRTEPSAVPAIARPAGAVLAVSTHAPRSQTFSCSTPRAPPTALRLV